MKRREFITLLGGAALFGGYALGVLTSDVCGNPAQIDTAGDAGSLLGSARSAGCFVFARLCRLDGECFAS